MSEENKGPSIVEALGSAVTFARLLGSLHRNLVLEGLDRMEATYIVGVYVEALHAKTMAEKMTQKVDIDVDALKSALEETNKRARQTPPMKIDDQT